MELLRQEEAQNSNKEEEKKDKKKNKKDTNVNKEKSKTKSNLNLGKKDTEMEQANEMKIKENIPDDILSLFQEYIHKIIDYLSPIFDHYKKGKFSINN